MSMRLTALVALTIGALLGLLLPDLDQRLPFLLHRSILTHSAVLPLVCALCVARPHSAARSGVVGGAVALAVHLAFDLFPQRWQGFALLHVPIIGQLSAALSIALLAGSILVCLILALWLASPSERVVAGCASLVAFVVVAPGERVVWPPLLVLILGWVVASVLPVGRRHVA